MTIGWVSAYGAFLKRYPYCRRKVWALFLMDNIGPILDIYVYFTMNDDGLTRAADVQDIEDWDIDSIEEIQDAKEFPNTLIS